MHSFCMTGFVFSFVTSCSSTRDGVDAEVGVCGRRPARSIPIVYNGDPFGTAAIALSLATNVFSTALIGFKMWCAQPHAR